MNKILDAITSFLRGNEVEWLFCPRCWGRFRKGIFAICPSCDKELMEDEVSEEAEST